MFKKWFAAVFLSLSFLSCALAKENIPEPNGWVNDFANVVSDEYKQKLNSLISDLEQKTSTEIAVVTIESISPYDEAGYARLLFDKWKPGKKGKDNGVLVLLAIKERAWRIETGYGVEAILPDGLCGGIGRDYMVPYFKEGRYGEGLYQGVAQIAAVVSGEITPDYSGNSSAPNSSRFPFEILFFGIIFIAFLALTLLSWKVIFVYFVLSISSVLFAKSFSLLIRVIIHFIILSLAKLCLGSRIRNFYGTGYRGGSYGSGFGGFSGGGFGGGFGGGGGAGGRF